jgi:hypothetical protein
MPKQLPRNPTNAPSPPEEPPDVKVLLNGFVVTLQFNQPKSLQATPFAFPHTHKDYY